jgi:hypothetical protein
MVKSNIGRATNGVDLIFTNPVSSKALHSLDYALV